MNSTTLQSSLEEDLSHVVNRKDHCSQRDQVRNRLVVFTAHCRRVFEEQRKQMRQPDEHELQSRFIPRRKAEDSSSSFLCDTEAPKDRYYCTFIFYIVLAYYFFILLFLHM